METPRYKFLPEDYDHVYEPAEDSFLLLDALEQDLDELRSRQPSICLEVGPGSGIIVSALAKCLGSRGHFLGVDINPAACRMTRKTASLNDCLVDVVNGDLLGSFRDSSVDLLVFNPPYVPTAADEGQLEEQIGEFSEGAVPLVRSWAGGKDGMLITKRLLDDLGRILSARGIFYLLLIKENDPDSVICHLEDRGFDCCKAMERRIRGEHLFVIKIQRR
ncbi:methyltransferase N6AMT1 [Uranotaenia lowii]|uniref:methyltransferase N6AMT1 n=1 Tax=Uranotaenia lowii TaxID=190385 RepID=UPI002479CD10|nr:methyltransferase N6AMT1 [Uranotaenia lowii]